MNTYFINPLDWVRGYIVFPIGFYTYEKCTLHNGKPCRSCGDGGNYGGFGFQLLFIGISFKIKQ